jgi:hypothetical protein
MDGIVTDLARTLLSDILDYFIENDVHPGDEWSFSDDQTTFGLDFWGKDGTKFWLNLNRDGTIDIFWKRAGVIRLGKFKETP